MIAQVDRILSSPLNSSIVTSDVQSVEGDEQRKQKLSAINVQDSLRRHQFMQQQALDSTNGRKYAEYSTESLVALSHESTEEYKLIAKELNRRCGGTSVGYLTSAQLTILCEHYASCRILQFDELVRLHAQLQSDVQQLTDHDPFEILCVPGDKLLHLAAATLCLQNANKYQ